MKCLSHSFCNYRSISTLEATCCTHPHSSSFPKQQTKQCWLASHHCPLITHHPRDRWRIPGHQPCASPSSQLHLSPDDHIACKGECISVYFRCEHVYLINRGHWTFFLHTCVVGVHFSFVENLHSFYATVSSSRNAACMFELHYLRWIPCKCKPSTARWA